MDLHLDKLSVDALDTLMHRLNLLAKIGDLLSDVIKPVFNLTPGQPALVLPPVFAAAPLSALLVFRPLTFADTISAAGQSGVSSAGVAESGAGASVAAAAPAPLYAPPAFQIIDDPDPISAAQFDMGFSSTVAAAAPAPPDARIVDPVRAEDETQALIIAADNSGDGGAFDHMVAREPEPPAPILSTAIAKPPNWSEAEDAQAIEIYVAARLQGENQQRCYALIAAALGRPVSGCAFRMSHKLLQRSAQAVIDRKRGYGGQPSPATPAAPATVNPPDPLTEHLGQMSMKSSWTPQRDMALLELACDGWDMNAIGNDLGIDAKAVKDRFDALTGVYRDPNDRICRRWAREAVRDRLRQMVPQAAE